MIARLRDLALYLVESHVRLQQARRTHRGLTTAPLAIASLCLLPLPLSSAVHYATHFALPQSLGISCALAIAVGAVWWPIRDRQPKPLRIWGFTALWLVLVSGLAIELFYDPFVYGMPSTGAIDPVGHVIELATFVDHPRIYYGGMTAFHGVAHWLEQIGLDPFRAFRLLLYALLVATLIYAALVQGALAVHLHRYHPGIVPAAGLPLASLALGWYPASTFLFPIIHGYQIDGYYPQLMGLVPLLVAALLYAVCRHRLQRLLALALALTLLRFSYLLNFPDLVSISTIVVAVEAFTGEERRKQRLLLLALVGAGAILSAYLYHTMFQLAAWQAGGIPRPHLAWSIAGTASLALLLLGVPLFTDRCLPRCPASLRRLCTFVGSYGLLTVVVQGAWIAAARMGGRTGEELYMMQKYAFSAWVLVVTTAVPCLAYVLVAMIVAQARPFSRHRMAAAISGLAIAGAAAACFARSLPEHYVETFTWRRRDAPSRAIALADLAAWAIIDRVLAARGRRFNGFLAPSSVETHFAAYVYRDRAARLPVLEEESGLPLAFDYPRVASAKPGDCVFWLEPRLFQGFVARTPLDQRRRAAAEKLHRGRKTCVRYQRLSYPERPVELCYFCRPPGPPHARGSTATLTAAAGLAAGSSRLRPVFSRCLRGAAGGGKPCSGNRARGGNITAGAEEPNAVHPKNAVGDGDRGRRYARSHGCR